MLPKSTTADAPALSEQTFGSEIVKKKLVLVSGVVLAEESCKRGKPVSRCLALGLDGCKWILVQEYDPGMFIS